jgi:hypothetical protein
VPIHAKGNESHLRWLRLETWKCLHRSSSFTTPIRVEISGKLKVTLDYTT